METISPSIISNITYKRTAFFALFSVFYIDYFAPSAIGQVVSLLLFVYILWLLLKRPCLAFQFYLILFAVIPPFPRNILDVYEHLQVTQTITYNTVTSMPLAGIGMIQWLTLCFIGFFLIRIIKNRIKLSTKAFSLMFFILSFPLITSLVHLIAEPNTFLTREVITGIRFPMYLVLGILFFLNYKNEPVKLTEFLIKTLVAISVIYCIRIPIFLILSIFEHTPSLDLGLVPHIPFAVLFSLLLFTTKSKQQVGLILILLLSVLSPSRGQLFSLFLSIGIFICLTGFSFKRLRTLISLITISIVILLLTSLLNDRFYNFFMWKLSEFSFSSEEGISGSGLVRVFEFLNISDILQTNPLRFFFGSGLSGYFTFESYPFPFPELLDLKSYQDFELASGIYYHPHFFINILLLKFGFLGLFLYTAFIISFFIKCLRRKKSANDLDTFFLISFGLFFSFSLLLDMHFRGYYAIIFPILYGQITNKIKYESFISIKKNIV